MKKYILSGLVAFSLVMPLMSLAQVDQGDVDTSGDTACAIISVNLRYGSRDASTGGAVSVLQDFLNSHGYLSSQPTGFFGSMTRTAVAAFQKAHGIPAVPPGFVGSITRAKIQSIDCGTTSPVQPTPPMTPGIIHPTPTPSPTQKPPYISGTDSTGMITPCVNVIVNGANFNDASYVKLDDNQSIKPFYLSPSSLTFTLPSNVSVGYHTIQIIEKAGSLVSNRVTLTVVAAPSTISPPSSDTSFQILPLKMDNNGPAFAGQSYTVVWKSGSGNANQLISCSLGSVTAVKGDGAYNLGQAYLVQGSLTFTVPSSIASGNYLISCNNQYATLYANGPVFAVQGADVPSTIPTITSIIPSQAETNAAITINGSNLTSGGHPAVRFYSSDGTLAGTAYFISMNSISAASISFNLNALNTLSGGTAALTPGTYQVKVETPAGISNALSLIVAPSSQPPVIDLFSVSDGGKFSLGARNYSTITFRANCGSFAHVVLSYDYTSQSFPTGNTSLCNAEQYSNLSNTGNNAIVDSALWLSSTLGGTVTGSSYIGNGPTTNNSGTVILTVKVCNNAGACVQSSTPYHIYAKG